jgi:hypothetical protein
MNQFWWATALFVIVGLTPLVVATVMNRRERRRRQRRSRTPGRATPR